MSVLKTREEALDYALSFPETYQDAPFHDDNWQLVRVKGNIPDADVRRMIAESYDLDKNSDPDTVPCYRVVNAKGVLAGAFAFGGAGVQAGLLEADGISVADGNKLGRRFLPNSIRRTLHGKYRNKRFL